MSLYSYTSTPRTRSTANLSPRSEQGSTKHCLKRYISTSLLPRLSTKQKVWGCGYMSTDTIERQVAVIWPVPLQLKDKEWHPDFGPAKFVPSWGATVTGARDFLIAYNVNLLATKQQANRIALNIREQGRGPDKVQPQSLSSIALLCC